MPSLTLLAVRQKAFHSVSPKSDSMTEQEILHVKNPISPSATYLLMEVTIHLDKKGENE
ncbi:MAG: hypothetical protein QOH41_339 [Blastocatellia bacterium]|nr:hypothetical protein [Blastocatellia bacterium]